RFFRSLHRRQRGNSSIFSPDLLRTYISTRSLYRPSHKNKVNDTIKSSSSRQKPEHALPATSARSLTRTS
ncbi:hypothetical protein PoMZ_00453, partial [Pyricularia oryzae]